jgi:hypothetical protein
MFCLEPQLINIFWVQVELFELVDARCLDLLKQQPVVGVFLERCEQ